MEPEFMTSQNAERVNFELKGKSEFIDASAAALILQSFLDRRIGMMSNDEDLGE
jgi:RNase H-fold protein (predicted Holliday junction resolvase)